MNVEKQLSVTNNEEIHISAASIWQIIGNFNGVNNWHPAVAQSTLIGTGRDSGDQRILTLEGGGEIKEELLNYSDSKMSYTYQIINSPLPVEHYIATINVVELSPSSCKVSWSSIFEAKGVDDKEAKSVIAGIFRSGLDNLDKMVSSGIS